MEKQLFEMIKNLEKNKIVRNQYYYKNNQISSITITLNTIVNSSKEFLDLYINFLDFLIQDSQCIMLARNSRKTYFRLKKIKITIIDNVISL